MKITIQLLVADDQIKNAHVALHSAMKSVIKQKSYSPPWHVPLSDDDMIEVQCEFLDSKPEVKKLLMDPKAMAPYDLIVLDNDWAGDERHGTDLIAEIHRAGITHPPLVLYTQHRVIPYLTDTLKNGAYAAVQKNDKHHFMNVLITIAVTKKAQMEHV